MRVQLPGATKGRRGPVFGRRQPMVRVRGDVRVAGVAGSGLLLAVFAGFLLGFAPALRRYLRMERM